MANRVYLAATNKDSIYPSQDESYKSKDQTIAADSYAIPLLWLAMFRVEDIRTQSFQVDGETVEAWAPIAPLSKCLAQLEQSVPILARAFPGKRSLQPHADMLAAAIKAPNLAYLTIELQELEWLEETPGQFLQTLGTAYGVFNAPAPLLSRIFGRKPAAPWREALFQVTALNFDLDFPPADLLMASGIHKDEDLANHTRLLGASWVKNVPWEKRR